MKLHSRGIGILFVALSIMGVAVVSHGQIRSVKQKGLGMVKLSESKLQIFRKPKKSFLPFQPRDIRTGKPVKGTDTLTLPDGRRFKASEYYDQLNKLEKEFNDLGYSLRDPDERTVIQKTLIDKAALVQKSKLAIAEHKPIRGDRPYNPPPTSAFGGGKFNAVLGNLAGRIPAGSLKPLPTPRYDKSFRYDEGDPDTFTAYVSGKLSVVGQKTVMASDGEFKVGGSLFKKSKEILRMYASMYAPANGPMNGRIDMSLLGISVHSYSNASEAAFSHNKTFSTTFRKPITTINFSLGPVPMSGEVGIVGQLGVTYGLAVDRLVTNGSLAPFASIGVYAQVGPGIPIISAGVGVNLFLVKDTLQMNAEGSVQDAATAAPYLLLAVNGTNVLEMLSGSVYFYVKIYVPKLTPPFYKKKQYDWDVFEWEGFKVSGQLWNESKRVNL